MRMFLMILPVFLTLHRVEADDKVILGDFSHNRRDGWEQKNFKGETRYQLQTLDGEMVLQADSRSSGSGLFKEQRVDLERTPYLNWSWRIVNRLDGLNEQTKAGDDYVARVYVVIKGGLAFWQTRAINYVWAGNTSKESIWPNAFAGDHAMMLAVRGPEAPVNTWLHEKRNVRADLKKVFGEDLRMIDAVAIMTDTDNSNTQAGAFYGDIWFSRD